MMVEETCHLNDEEMRLACLKLAHQWSKETFQTQSGNYKNDIGIVATAELFWKFVKGKSYKQISNAMNG